MVFTTAQSAGSYKVIKLLDIYGAEMFFFFFFDSKTAVCVLSCDLSFGITT